MEYPEYMREYLYSRGYFITDDQRISIKKSPFFGNWRMTALGKYSIFTHKWRQSYTLPHGDVTFFLIGHSYNPFTMQADEMELLRELATAYDTGVYTAKLNEFSGVFVTGYCLNDGTLYLSCDATGMLVAYYGSIQGNLYITSHSNLLGDICRLVQSDYVQRLKSYRFYGLFGKMLPGDLSPFDGIKHLLPNHMLCFQDGEFTISRYWPVNPLTIAEDSAAYQSVIEKSADILHNSLALTAEKWPGKAAISMTGGCDSKTTLSCANGLENAFSYYSFASSEAERVDADAAFRICKNLGLKHTVYPIPAEDAAYMDIELWRDLLERNCGNIGSNNRNDVRKRIFFTQHHDFDVEVKSWVSEVARAYYCKRFDRECFPNRPTARYLTALYKVFVTERSLVRETDRYFAEFLEKYYADDVFDKVAWTDLIFWEYRMSSWNGLVISNEQPVSHDITIPYNNRLLLELLLSTPQEYRIKDVCHKDIQRLMNPQLADMDISVTNLKHTNRRAKLENLYLNVQSRLPF